MYPKVQIVHNKGRHRGRFRILFTDKRGTVMEKSFYKYRFSAFQVIGIIMLVLGVLALTLTGVYAVKYKRVDQKALHYESNAEDGISDEEYPGGEPDIPAKAKKNVYSAVPGLMLGAALIICAVPMFYVPHGEGFSFRRRRRRRNVDDMTDKEFDYPDEEFDFIIDEETRAKLLEEKFRRIYENNHKL